MRIRTKIIGLVATALFGACAVCGTFAVNQYMNVSVEKLAAMETEKLQLAQQVFSQIGTREDLEKMGETARDAYLKYQFERCYQKGYALLKGRTCIKNMTDYDISAPETLGDRYVVQRLGERYLLIMKRELPYPRDFYVLSVKDITSTWEEAREQAAGYFYVFFAVFMAVMMIAAAVIRHMLKALEDLQAQAERIKGGDFDSKVMLTSRDELQDLSDSLNRMSDQIRQQMEDLELLPGAMAHEMKTPLTSIMGYADSLLHVRLSDEQREQSLEAIYRCAGRLDAMSGKLLQLVGLYENREIERKPVDIRQVLERVYREYKRDLREKDISCEISGTGEGELQEKSSMIIQGDGLLLASLFGNLVSNSIKALDSFGKIWLTVNPAELTVCVEDNGRGIPAEDIPYVTKAFYMVDKSRSRRQQGTGLGLALARRIVKVHGGTMDIESSLGEGTRVTVAFPREPGEQTDFTN